ncbi:catechol 1,2-dioxygenase [Colletotrichum liriopes]|uniref:Catechol 1,2-dioxygenase n=1 Tax=Colletotrichum liriopes TaxID=708192 RepID=A0AA37GUK8_9PEZI|nr:catechol 1,2-dioxygenase [Colletotrichum liriopes]
MADRNGSGTATDNGAALAEKAVYDPAFTDRVIAATGPHANPRLAQVMPSLLRHLHDFAREVDLTVGEWMAGVQMVGAGVRSLSSTYMLLTQVVVSNHFKRTTGH